MSVRCEANGCGREFRPADTLWALEEAVRQDPSLSPTVDRAWVRVGARYCHTCAIHTVLDVHEKEHGMSDEQEQEFNWDAESEQAETVTPAEVSEVQPTAAVEATQPAEGEAEATPDHKLEQKAVEAPLHERFPKGHKVVFVKGDIKGNYGEVLGTVEKAAVTYLKVRVTHYVKGRPRTGDQVKEMTVRGTTVELVDEIPTYVAPAPEKKVETVAAEA